jgi:hypothetical protein
LTSSHQSATPPCSGPTSSSSTKRSAGPAQLPIQSAADPLSWSVPPDPVLVFAFRRQACRRERSSVQSVQSCSCEHQTRRSFELLPKLNDLTPRVMARFPEAPFPGAMRITASVPSQVGQDTSPTARVRRL